MSSRLRIVADRNIPLVAEAFADLGEVVTLPQQALTREAVRGADLLLTRSTVKVGPALLEGSRVRFVATATIGTDHLDVAWLGDRGIAWASAPGSNAGSVVQWWAAALLALGVDPAETRVGVVGVGQVGGRIARLCAHLAETAGAPPPLLCDPPRARREGGDFVALDALLAQADLVTLHVPLERRGADATYHLIGPGRLPSRVRLVNASRGEVVASEAVPEGAALDVFEGEPSPHAEVVTRCRVATAHIAGHSVDGKVNGTRMVYEAACAFLGRAPTWRPALPPPPVVAVSTRGKPDAAILLEAMAAGYRVDADDAALRRIVALPPAERAPAFIAFRQSYPERRELDLDRLALTPPRPDLAERLRALRA